MLQQKGSHVAFMEVSISVPFFSMNMVEERVMFNSFQDRRRWMKEKVLTTAYIHMGSCQRAQGLSTISFFKSVPNEPLVLSVYTSKGKLR